METITRTEFRKWREGYQLSYRDVQRGLGGEISVTHLFDFENGNRNLSPEKADALARLVKHCVGDGRKRKRK
jgi:predicted transcriptional regulator